MRQLAYERLAESFRARCERDWRMR